MAFSSMLLRSPKTLRPVNIPKSANMSIFPDLSAKLIAMDEADSVVPNSKVTQKQHHFFQFSDTMKVPEVALYRIQR